MNEVDGQRMNEVGEEQVKSCYSDLFFYTNQILAIAQLEKAKKKCSYFFLRVTQYNIDAHNTHAHSPL